MSSGPGQAAAAGSRVNLCFYHQLRSCQDMEEAEVEEEKKVVVEEEVESEEKVEGKDEVVECMETSR